MRSPLRKLGILDYRSRSERSISNQSYSLTNSPFEGLYFGETVFEDFRAVQIESTVVHGCFAPSVPP